MNKFILILISLMLLNSCKKEKFENAGLYFANFNGTYDYNGENKKYSTTKIEVVLDNESKNSIEYNGILMNKNGRIIKGELPPFKVHINASNAILELKRNLFNDNIEGTFTTTILAGGQINKSTGTVVLEATF